MQRNRQHGLSLFYVSSKFSEQESAQVLKSYDIYFLSIRVFYKKLLETRGDKGSFVKEQRIQKLLSRRGNSCWSDHNLHNFVLLLRQQQISSHAHVFQFSLYFLSFSIKRKTCKEDAAATRWQRSRLVVEQCLLVVRLRRRSLFWTSFQYWVCNHESFAKCYLDCLVLVHEFVSFS